MKSFNTKRLENRRMTLVHLMAKNLNKQRNLSSLNETYALEIVELNNKIRNYG